MKMFRFMLASFITGVVLLTLTVFSTNTNAAGLSYTEQLIIKHEGIRLDVYKDHLGHLTVGVGHLVKPEDNLKYGDAIDAERVYSFFRSDLVQARDDAKAIVKGFENLHWKARVVLINMSFQLGYNRLSKFKKTIAFIEDGDFVAASEEMLDSLWAKQTPKRAKELSYLMSSI